MKTKNSKLLKLKKVFGNRIKTNKDLFLFLTLRTRTRAEYFFEARSKSDWQKAVLTAYQLHLPVFALGGCSNIAPSFQLIKGLVIKNSYIKLLKISETKKDGTFLVSSGYPTAKLVNEMVEQGYEGLEYHKGLPGTVGGAIFMNSKWTKPLTYFSDGLTKAILLTKQGGWKEVDKKYFQFNYDFSLLHRTKEILIEVIFKFKKVDSDILKKRADQAINYRAKTQPKGVASCGCFFRNIVVKDQRRLGLPTSSVGYLIEKAGLKGLTVGDFTISPVHGNFIINKGLAKSEPKDLKKLLTIIKKKIKNIYGVELKEEVVIM